MLRAQHTKNMTGVILSGDPEDFRALYEALHEILGHTEEMEDGPAIRVLGVCYDIRHAFMGDRGAGFWEHGFDDEMLAYLSLVGPKANLYVSFETLWPEMFYVLFVLQDFVRQYEKREKAALWDMNMAQVRYFQGTIFKLIEETLTPRQFSSFKKWVNDPDLQQIEFAQYVDYLNGEWHEMERPAREKNFNIFAKRVSQRTPDYEREHKKLIKAAIEHGCHPSELRYPSEFYDHIVW